MTRTRSLLALALATALGLAVAQGMMGTPNDPRTPGRGYGDYGSNGMMQPGYGGYGPGGMGMMGFGHHGRGGYGMTNGMGMMSGTMMRVLSPDAQPLADDELRRRLEAAARTFGPDVAVDDVMPFTDHSYAQFVGPDGTGVTEVLVDRYSGLVTPEPGPNMMWNRRSGMGPWSADPGATLDRYDETGARDLADTFLDTYLPGAEVLAGQAFPGYMTFDYGRDGRVDGMLSVHFGSGQVWPHTWHGAFRGETGGHTD